MTIVLFFEGERTTNLDRVLLFVRGISIAFSQRGATKRSRKFSPGP